MELTIEQARQQGIAAQKEGKLQEAERVYHDILRSQPVDPIANHNLGILRADRHQSHLALPFFLTALESNPKIEQFWVSYINALINVDNMDDAKEFIEKANKAGFYGEKFDVLSTRLLSPLELHAKGKFLQAQDGCYTNFLKALHEKTYEMYFEIGTCEGSSLVLSQSPSIAIDPYFRLKNDPIGKKDFCLIFQQTSDSFFESTLPKFPNLKCQLAFIDGMHLFEHALRDFINLAKISSEQSLFLFHDPMPWSYKMATRDYKTIQAGEDWTGDIWKLVPILMDIGMNDNIKVLTSAPSGILAILNPGEKIIAKLEEKFNDICAEWLDVELSSDALLNMYQRNMFMKPEMYLRWLE